MFALVALAFGGVSAGYAAEVAAPIATLGGVSGKVLVSTGNGFVPATQNVALKAGDKVLVGEQSFATLNYKACNTALTTPGVVTIGAVAPCEQANVSPVADAAMPEDNHFPMMLPLLLVGGAGIVGIIALTNDNEEPVSTP